MLSGQFKVNLALNLAEKLSFRPNIKFMGLTELGKAPVEFNKQFSGRARIFMIRKYSRQKQSKFLLFIVRYYLVVQVCDTYKLGQKFGTAHYNQILFLTTFLN